MRRSLAHEDAGQAYPSGPCASWLSPASMQPSAGRAPRCRRPTPGPASDRSSSRARPGRDGRQVAQAAGALPEGRPIGIKVNASTVGTIVAQAICGRTLVRATFLAVRFNVVDRARLDVAQIGDTPVILMKHNGRTLPPRRETLVDMGWLSIFGPGGCAFRVS